MSMKNYFSCGQQHTHKMPFGSNVVWDKDGLIEVEAETPERAALWVHSVFGRRWSSQYSEEELTETLPFFPNGIVAKFDLTQ